MDRDTGLICIQDTLPNILDTGVEQCTLVWATHFVLHQTHVTQHHTHIAQHHTHPRTMLNPLTLNDMNARSHHGFMHCKYLNITQALLQIITRLFSLSNYISVIINRWKNQCNDISTCLAQSNQHICLLLLVNERTTALISPPPLPDQISTSVLLFHSIAIATLCLSRFAINSAVLLFSKVTREKGEMWWVLFLTNNNYVIISLTLGHYFKSGGRKQTGACRACRFGIEAGRCKAWYGGLRCECINKHKRVLFVN
jgi:hypothetical protein